MDISTLENNQQEITNIVNKMYTNGSDARSEKNGNPRELIKKLTTNDDICVIGLWKKLPSDYQSLISSNGLSDEEKILVLKFIRKYAGKYNPNDYYCSIKRETLHKIDSVIEGDLKNYKYIMKFSKYFLDTERQKIAGKSNNKYSFNPSTYEKSKEMLLGLISS